ncbi:phd finger protein, putative [Babesia microti strain RI]|uniref:Phd finger protein, putative n=1 Tax=Babesia microti (strain RI) TaxID=1133968 RepID=A0A1N6LW82_BABMR|nr:phd finger protein, putative [Babesia microti strain RI]SIO73132.1 phd finger protein, putative [Babesia microti strain RI]|eukprot:XP_021337244.1 phd finger protein, putative [Babesia microti strain RI]
MYQDTYIQKPAVEQPDALPNNSEVDVHGNEDNNVSNLELSINERSSDDIQSDSVTQGENSDHADVEVSDQDNIANTSQNPVTIPVDVSPPDPLSAPNSPVIEQLDAKKRKKPVSEGTNFTGKICIGDNHQVPFMPSFFLDESHTNVKYDLARLVYSPYMMEKFKRKRISEGKLECAIKSEYEMAEFIQHVAKSWKTYQVWHPFSPEFAYKILHYAEYDPHKAIQLMSDPHFNFNMICDPPTRKYDNKWKPRDRRGQIPSHPYPSPVTLRSYLSRRQISNYTAR